MTGKKNTGDAGYEIPEQMRDFADKSVEQARKAFDSVMSATQKAVSSVETSAHAVQSGTQDVSRMALDFAEANVNSAFEFAQKLVRAGDLREILDLQQQFIQAQMAAFNEQTRTISETVAKTAGEIAKSTKD